MISPNVGGYFNSWRATNIYHQPAGVALGVGHHQQMQQQHQQQVTNPAQHQMMPHCSSAETMMSKQQATPPHVHPRPPCQRDETAGVVLPQNPQATYQTSPGAAIASSNTMCTPSHEQALHYPHNEANATVAALGHLQQQPSLNQTRVIVSAASSGPTPSHIQQVQSANFQPQYYSSLNYLQPEQHNMPSNIPRNVANVSCSYG